MKRVVLLLLVVFLFYLSAASPATVITNPSFENCPIGETPTGLNWPMPSGWNWRSVGNVNGMSYEYWASEGDYSLYLYCQRFKVHQSGDYLEFFQPVNLTDVDSISFDVRFSSPYRYSVPYVSIDGLRLWSKTSSSSEILKSETIDVSNLTGVREICFGLEVLKPFSYPSYEWADGNTNFDNLRLIPEPATLSLLVLGGLPLLRKRK